MDGQWQLHTPEKKKSFRSRNVRIYYATIDGWDNRLGETELTLSKSRFWTNLLFMLETISTAMFQSSIQCDCEIIFIISIHSYRWRCIVNCVDYTLLRTFLFTLSIRLANAFANNNNDDDDDTIQFASVKTALNEIKTNTQNQCEIYFSADTKRSNSISAIKFESYPIVFNPLFSARFSSVLCLLCIKVQLQFSVFARIFVCCLFLILRRSTV